MPARLTFCLIIAALAGCDGTALTPAESLGESATTAIQRTPTAGETETGDDDGSPAGLPE